MAHIWLEVLQRTYEAGELFTLGLHPERIEPCEDALRAVLAKARSLSPSVWIARLDEIADWWRVRAEATYRVAREGEGVFRLTVDGPVGTTILARDVSIEAPTTSWTGDYTRVLTNDFVFRADRLPLVGVSVDSPDSLVSFLRQQGYLVDRSMDARACAFYIDRREFTREDERTILEEVTRGSWPLLRLGRWPHGARSALSVTGDIDALTLWDYGLRFFG